jgi:hypothetical protein
MTYKLLLLLLITSFVSSCNTEEVEALLEKAATNTTKGDSSETINTSNLVTFTCELGELKRNKCLLPSVEGESALRIIEVKNVVNTGSSDCELGSNMRILGNLKGIRIRKGCEGTFVASTTRELKRIKYGTKTPWSEISIKALDFGEAEVEDGILMSDSDTGVLKTDKNGLGVAGGRHAGNQINYDVNLGQSQGLLFELPTNTLGINVVLSNLYKSESTGERAELIVLDEEYQVIATKTRGKLARYKKEDRNHVGQVRFRGIKGAKYLLVKAVHYKGVEVKENGDSSDFYVRYLNVLTSK